MVHDMQIHLKGIGRASDQNRKDAIKEREMNKELESTLRIIKPPNKK